MKLLTVVGARPQLIKAAAVGRAIEAEQAAGARLRSVLVHTGQHYDFEMSRAFFAELGLQAPDHDLAVGSGPPGEQTGRMLAAIERVLDVEQPDTVLVYGDTNSTLAGALAAAKRHVPVAHVEAGLRSYNRRMPEEINRVLTDHLSSRLFCPGELAAANLSREGITAGVSVVGDVMYEQMRRLAGTARLPETWHAMVGGRPYALASLHRAENTDDPDRLAGILRALADLCGDIEVVLPLHPRTARRLEEFGLAVDRAIHAVRPIGYGEMIAAQRQAAVVITDSGGVQKEAYWLGVPCVTVRDETEWLETLEGERNLLCGARRDSIHAAAARQLRRGTLTPPNVERASAASSIVRELLGR
jgi:UDP-N-acetylglucosamine 2-epimerase